jgi:hypothetical protein
MVTRLNEYLNAVSVFDRIEVALLSFSRNQVRKVRDEDLSDLMASIHEHGLLEPIIVRPKGKGFEVIAGNRRLRACKLLRFRRVNCIVADLNDAEAYEVSIIENVQRSTLNPLEEALALPPEVCIPLNPCLGFRDLQICRRLGSHPCVRQDPGLLARKSFDQIRSLLA